MKIITCNIRGSNADDGPDNWELRKEICRDAITETVPDVICFQEMTSTQHAYLLGEMPEFVWVGSADEPAGHHPVNAIFYRAETYRLTSSSTYWLSETPHIPGSFSWDSMCVRLATWVRLQEIETGREVRVINTHLDHVGQAAREGQARTIASDAAAYPDEYPQILTGDMNCNSSNAAMKAFFDAGFTDTYEGVHGTLSPGETFHEFDGDATTLELGKIDWILSKGAVGATDARIVTANKDGRYPSDHFFVTAEVG